nr:TPA_asm: hypothetical protein HUJ06_013492 [Nelumbo nucifera]
MNPFPSVSISSIMRLTSSAGTSVPRARRTSPSSLEDILLSSFTSNRLNTLSISSLFSAS